MNNVWSKKIENRKVINAIVIIICCMVFIPLMHLAIYSRPCVDDYNYSVETHDLVKENDYNIISLIGEALKVDLKFYNSWQGLYTSAFILSLQPGIFGEQFYFIGAWLLLIIMFVCIYFFIKTINKIIFNTNKFNLTITLVLLATILTGLPSAVQGIYWFNGAWNYMPFFFLTLVNISLLLRFLYLGKKNNDIYSTVLSFIISGGNHVTAFLNIMILTIYSLTTFKKSKSGIISLTSAIIGFIIMYMAPGTQIRQSNLISQGTVKTILMSIIGYFQFIQNTISIQWLFIFLLIILLSFILYKEKYIKEENFKYNPLVLFIVKTIIICGCLCVPYKAMGGFGAGRLTNVIYCTYTILNLFFYIYFFTYVLFKVKIKLIISSNFNLVFNNVKNIALIMIITGIMFFQNSNSIKATKEIITGKAVEFATACDERYRIMEESQEEITYVKKLPDDEMLKFDDITTNKDDWRNKGWKNYYKKTTIIKE